MLLGDLLMVYMHAGQPGSFAALLHGDDASPREFISLSQLEDAIGMIGADLSRHQIISIYRHMPKDAVQRGSISSLLRAVCS